MKLVRACAVAGSLLASTLQAFAGDDGAIWRSAQPVWKASKGSDWLITPAPSPTVAPKAAEAGPAIQPNEPKPSFVAPALFTKPIAPDALELVDGPELLAMPKPIEPALEPFEAKSPVLPEMLPLPKEVGSRPTHLPHSAEEFVVAPQEPPEPEKLPPPRSMIEAPKAKLVPPLKEVASQASLGRPSAPSASSTFDDGFWQGVDPTESRFRVRAEFLAWRVKNDQVPVLGTTGTPASGGILGQPGTQLLYGPGDVSLEDRTGGRFRASYAFDDCGTCGVDASFLFLGRRQTTFTFNSDSTPVISRPVFVLNFGGEFVETLAFPNFSTGTLTIAANSRLWGFDANIFRRVCATCDRYADVFIGYRNLNLDESINIVENTTAGPDNNLFPVGTRGIVQDSFATRNRFNDAQVGAHLERNWGQWFVDVRGSIAIGVNHQTIDINGSQVITQPGMAPQTFVGGLLAARSNIGRNSRDRFSIVPDVALNLGYAITPHVRGYIGYSFLYWTNVARPGEQIDRVVDLTQIPNTPPVPSTGQRRPAVLFQDSDFWAHGINLGVEWLW